MTIKKPEAAAQPGAAPTPVKSSTKGEDTVRMVSSAGTKVTVSAALADLLRGYKRA